MTRRRIVRRKSRNGLAQSVPRNGAVPMTAESLGLKPDAQCEILIVGSSNYCSFTLARLGRLGISKNIGITASDNHAMWAVKNLSPRIVISSRPGCGRLAVKLGAHPQWLTVGPLSHVDELQAN